MYTGPGWDGVDFIHSSSYDAVFKISDQNSDDKTLIIYLLLNTVCKAISAFHSAPFSPPPASEQIGQCSVGWDLKLLCRSPELIKEILHTM